MKVKLSYLASLVAILCTFNLHAATSIEECKKFFDDATYKEAIPSCLQLSESGDSSAQTMLGEIYDLEGASDKTAFWWKKAAEAGYQPARNLLALKYFYGGTVLGPEKGWDLDYAKAYKIWKKDADEGVASSQFMIGIMHQKGYGVAKDLSEAYFWLKVSLQNGYKLSTDVLIEISRDISPLQKQIGHKKLMEHQQLMKKSS